MEQRLVEVNALSNDSQARLSETSEVLKGLEDNLKATEVIRYHVYCMNLTISILFSIPQFYKYNVKLMNL
jgi:hypothetical protein